ncbi:MAG: TIGR02117 family protein [Crocinitomicaceae bacterium]|nr:TIGR02117 family protein [Crocinitomicaceae bacterium]
MKIFRILSSSIQRLMELVKMSFYFLLYFAEFFAAFVVAYFAFAFICLIVPLSSNHKQKGELTEIFVKSNGVHCDLVIPIAHQFDWKEWIGIENFATHHADYLSVGWGDKGFYVDTPEWKDLKFSTAFRALFMNTQTLMHLTLIDKPECSEKCKSILIDQEQYKILVQTIQDRFVKNASGKPILIEGKGYTPDDNFYEAYGSYSLFMTCNVWTNNVLRRIKVKTVYWAPFEQWVLKYL